jgi:beta-glucanase (GH16 family)
MKYLPALAMMGLGMMAGSSTGSGDNAAPPGYKLVWADEFNKDGAPDPANWTFEQGFVRNEEAQWYQPQNARCEGGLLIIEAKREKKENPQYREGSTRWQQSRQYAEYTSACLTTQRLHSWMYGRFEMRGRIDIRAGLWPAFWTLGIERGWPTNGEIDIMEYYRGTLLANAAWTLAGRRGAQWHTVKTPIKDFNDLDWSSKFHIWRMDWDPNSLKLYVDGRLLNSTDVTQTFLNGSDGFNPFRQPHYILLNLAVGGTSGGDPSATQFPARFEVDYVRIYQQADKVANQEKKG